MAGTIFGLPMSQRVDANGKPQVGWLIYLYAANSSSPVDSYQDTGLTVKNPWPIAADSTGMMGQFWLADGSYRVRATTADGSITFFDIPNVQSLGPSSGSAPSGGVDPNAIFQTGDVLWMDVQGTRAGWVRDNGRTIGSASSGATERANADCQALFEYLWNGFADSICPVPGGRGGSAASDWTANKQITTPDKRGYIPGGLDDMGNSAASRWAGVPVVSGTVTTAGSLLGEAVHTLAVSESPTGLHTLNFADPGHSHGLSDGGEVLTDAADTPGTHSVDSGGVIGKGTISSNTTGISASLTDHAGGGSHNNVQKTVLGTFFRKL